MAEPASAARFAAPTPVQVPVHCYALVDLARAPQLLPLIDALTRTGAARCLFEGPIAEPLRRASPHIVNTARAGALMDRWQAEGRGRSWGVVLETPLPMHLARRHVRRFLQVKLPDGAGPVLMRIWDPRVLGVLLETADAGQLAALFRDVRAYHLEGQGGLRRVGLQEGALAVEVAPAPVPIPALVAPAPAPVAPPRSAGRG